MVTRSVLVVDDDADMLDALSDMLEQYGFSVTRASSGPEALELLRSRTVVPCALLTDLVMPVMSGWEFVDAMRSEASLRDIPVIVISGREQVHGDGVRFVTKPVFLPHLLNLLEEAALEAEQKRNVPLWDGREEPLSSRFRAVTAIAQQRGPSLLARRPPSAPPALACWVSGLSARQLRSHLVAARTHAKGRKG